ncbi:MAG: 23S rRNA (uracil(1939)-C(5))-methyltransferase RlmD [Subdoligranulum sp.]
MSLKKNQIFETTIENLSSDGSGVAHVEGQAVFVPGAAPGDVIRCRIVKALKSYAFGRIDAILAPGPGRVAPDCAVCTPCGGCGLRHLSYATECEAKTGFVRDAFARLGGFDVSSFEFSPVLALTDLTAHYRNKVQLPVGLDADGHVVTGFYAGRTHRIVPCPDCKLQPEWMNALARRACALLEANGIAPYDEETGKGRVRHLYMRQGWHSGQRLLCFVVNGNGLPNEAEICRTLQQEFQLTTVLINRNTARTNVILGRDTRTVLGPGVIEDTLAGVPIQMGVHEFYQVNTPAAELLYAKAKEFARLQPDDFLLDLYCGMGTIGLSMKPHCRRLVGVEVVPQAVEGAKTVAAHLGLPPEEADFYCMDAGEAATRLASEGAHPDVIVVDPPRKGCDNATLTAIVQMAPRTLVMVSCNPSTAARDAKFLCEQGYTLEKVQPVDLFPRTRHVTELIIMIFELNEFHRNINSNELIEDLRHVAEFLNQDTVTIDDYNQHGRFHATTLTRRFGSWFNCLSRAGLKPSRSKIGISDEELFEEIENIWIRLGKQPTYSQMRDLSKYSVGTYEKHFGGWRNTLVAFVKYINENDFVDNPIKENIKGEGSTHRSSRNINLRTRFIVLQRDKFKCCACGASPAKDPSVELCVDHIIPWSKGGETVIENLQTLCSKCNLGKSDLILD